jgi:hypothetical protein
MPNQLSEEKANTLFKKIYNDVVLPKLGSNTTYANVLQNVAYKKLGIHFKGVYASDQIPVLNDLHKYAILNLDKSTQSGSHWIAVAYEDNKIYVFDSFGRQSIKIIPSIYKSYSANKIIDTDHDAEQTEDEKNCGALSLTWLLFFDKWKAKNAVLI